MIRMMMSMIMMMTMTLTISINQMKLTCMTSPASIPRLMMRFTFLISNVIMVVMMVSWLTFLECNIIMVEMVVMMVSRLIFIS